MTKKESAAWDALRFAKTLAYFGAIPFIGNIGWLQKLLTGKSETKQPQEGDHKMGVVLVAGATGGVGKRVVRRLVEKGVRVRAIARNPDRAKILLGDKVEIVFADITIPETLTAEVMQDVTAIISCIGVRVQPIEGDTEDRAKYYQGIKFYMPEVVGDTPENVEYRGINNLVDAAKTYLNSGEKVVFDFTKASDDVKEIWGALDDVVMGGVSESSIT
jgi:NAD(P)H-binding